MICGLATHAKSNNVTLSDEANLWNTVESLIWDTLNKGQLGIKNTFRCYGGNTFLFNAQNDQIQGVRLVI